MKASIRCVLSHRRLSPSLIVSALALFFALGGVAKSVTPKAHASNAITRVKVLKNLDFSTSVSGPETVAPGGATEEREHCNRPDDIAISGGFHVVGADQAVQVAESVDNNLNTWNVIVENPKLDSSIEVEDEVVCVAPVDVSVTK